jgi:ketosteroid isomerase-like protein
LTKPTAESIVELERKALDRWGAGDPGGYLDAYGHDVTYFDPATAARVDGLEAMREYYRPWTGKIHIDRYELVNPRVVATDHMAVLSYNLVNYTKDADGNESVMNRWNSTAVYRREGGGWKIVHTHWSYIQPKIAE